MSGWSLLALAVAAVLVGFAKTAIGGVNSISIAIFASVLPSRESTGSLLLLLIVGDALAISTYRRHTDWPALLRLLPAIAAGVLVGVVFVARVDDVIMRRTIGATLLVLLGVHVLMQTRKARRPHQPDGAQPTPSARRRLLLAGSLGLLTGFTTMVANAGGAPMTLYLLWAGYSVLGFLGTAAWLFALVNLFKLPFSIGLGLISWDSLRLDALLVPAVILGALAGRHLIHRIDQRLFQRLVVGFTMVGSLNLLR